MQYRILSFLAAVFVFGHSVQAREGALSSILEKSMAEVTKKRSLVYDETKVDVELVKIGKQLAMRITTEDGYEYLLVQNGSGQWVPVHKVRKKIINSLVSFAKTLVLLSLGGVGSYYALSQYCETTEDGKKIMPSLSLLVTKLLNSLPADGSPEQGGGTSSEGGK